ncbi:glycoside hydrolase/phage tail family protein [Alphaproteobacteria bacterium KMM 3653]|uniref:Glycoside hydrolase/phage tail family protein n=1 Tax=Harenicola maris TaxID=2841044 RepID=A0AAP2CMI4_9RHOB|nr:glycoside hydrolase/phage tail family protein [Harenicola maris]
MATILLSAAGFAAGSALGGSVLGLSSAVIGRAIGATLGRVIDQSLMGQGSEVVETGRVDRFRLTGASEGSPMARVYGRVRVGGQVIWATQFQESSEESGGGKGAPSGPTTRSYSYSVSLAIALCEGEILRVGRIWADGIEVTPGDLPMRVYTGTEDQAPDSLIEAVEGAAPAYRGIAYVVFEDLQLEAYGNRVPQFSFEVVRPVDAQTAVEDGKSLSEVVQAVALVPGTGEYSLATTPVHVELGQGENQSQNVNTPSGLTDMATSIAALSEELPRCSSTSLIVSWFGNDLRCGECTLVPKVEQVELDGVDMPWQVSGLARADADAIATVEDRPIYGGTPADASVIEGIAALKEAGQAVMFYPFILMEQGEGNSLPDPYTGTLGQPVLPWRGRITSSLAPTLAGTPDGTAAAEAEVAAFMGQAAPTDFAASEGTVVYTGPEEWSYRRFILHYAHLCAMAGGVEAFCIGSEMRGLTQIRGAGGSFPAVEALRVLAGEVRAILGPQTKISYAADWSEYFGYHPQDGSGDVLFHLDPLWADPAIDFIGIDNYLPLSDWRDGITHADAGWGAIYNLDYLRANVAGGEMYDWYYASEEAREEQVRTPITDGAYDEPWVFRVKDLQGWWSNLHYNRIGGVRAEEPTAWAKQSKPIWFTEMGCAAIDKGTNQPNKFIDPKSSESQLPRYSDGTRDDFMQGQYLRAITSHFADTEANPVSEVYAGPMVDMSRAHVWAWDARPYPQFPALTGVWADGENYARGHWLNGRTSAESLPAVVAELCRNSGVEGADVSRLYGQVRGFALDGASDARAALQPLMLAFGFDAVEREGQLWFSSRTGQADAELDADLLTNHEELEGTIERIRAPEAETAGRVRLSYIQNDGSFAVGTAEAIFADEPTESVAHSEVALVLTRAEAQSVTERWLAEARVARDSVKLALPPSRLGLGAGDVLALEGAHYRADHVEHGNGQVIEAVRVDPNVYVPSDAIEEDTSLPVFLPPLPVHSVLMDLPLLTGEEAPQAPHLAVTASPWPGGVAVYSASEDAGYTLNTSAALPTFMGVTQTDLAAAEPGLWDRGPALRVKLSRGSLSSATPQAVLNGANAIAIGDGSAENWEVLQFAEAELVAPRTYDLRLRLRGQQGTDATMPAIWPEGSTVVVLNGRAQQIDLPLNARGLERFYRIGPAGKGYDDPSYTQVTAAFNGIGLRPYAPVHLRARPAANGDLHLTWVRRTRIDGDSWASSTVPLGEGSEEYLLRIFKDGNLQTEVTRSVPNWTLTAAEQSALGLSAPYSIDIAQVSDRFGPGPFGRIEIND